MTTVSIIITDDQFETGTFPAINLLGFANNYMMMTTGKESFKVQLVGFRRKNIKFENSTVHCSYSITDQLKHDLILLPGLDYTSIEKMDWSKYDKLYKWLESENKKGVKIAGLCLGSLLLAHAGLLENRQITTHWLGCELMRTKFPEVGLKSSEVVLHSDGIYTSGGGFSSVQLILYFIEEHCGRDVAIAIAKMSAIEYPLNSQNHFYIFQEQKSHGDEEILNAQRFMENNYYNDLKIDELSERAHMSSRNFIRRFKKATGETPIQYLQKIRIETAKKYLEGGNKNIYEVMENIGYSDLKSFAVLFKRLTGKTPAVYSKNFNRLGMETSRS